MKKFLFYLAIIGLALASCSKDKDCNCDNNGNGNNGNGTATPTVKTNQIILGFDKDLKNFNIPRHIPINYNVQNFQSDYSCPILLIASTLEESNKQLDAFYKKFMIVNSDLATITHYDVGEFIPEEDRESYIRRPYKFYSCTGKEGETFDGIHFGLMEKERTVVFYDSDDRLRMENYTEDKGGELQYTATSFYVFPTDEAYKEYVNILKSIYVDELEKIYFLDPKERLPLVLVGRVAEAPSFIPKRIEIKNSGNTVPNPTSFSFYNSKYDIPYLNGHYRNHLIGKYRFELYDKRFMNGAGMYTKELFIIEKRNYGEPFDEYYLALGGKRGYYALLSYQNVKLMPKEKAIVFYDGEPLNSVFLLFSDIEPYNDFVAILKEVINNKEAQDYVFIKD